MTQPQTVAKQRRRPLQRLIQGLETSDGAGVNLTRVIGTQRLDMVDPFLMLDAFRSDDPEDYVAGFPPHPHRGFETVTYLLAGHMEHADNAGHKGTIRTGGVQWMTAGRGIVHSEMPVQDRGLLEGFQLWVNLPASHKMIAPRYQEIEPEQIPVEQRPGEISVKVIAGTTSAGTVGPVRELITDVIYLDVTLGAADAHYEEPLPADYNIMLYVVDGEIEVHEEGGASLPIGRDNLALLGEGDGVVVTGQGHFLLLAGQPLNEPVARRGPFVMNTQEEIFEAFSDYQGGRF